MIEFRNVLEVGTWIVVGGSYPTNDGQTAKGNIALALLGYAISKLDVSASLPNFFHDSYLGIWLPVGVVLTAAKISIHVVLRFALSIGFDNLINQTYTRRDPWRIAGINFWGNISVLVTGLVASGLLYAISISGDQSTRGQS